MKLRNDVKQWRTVALVVLAANAALVGVWALFVERPIARDP